jgi:hypothetical protein
MLRALPSCVVGCLAASLGCAPGSATSSSNDAAETGTEMTGETDETGDGDGDGDQPTAWTLVPIRRHTTGPLTEPNPPDQMELLAVDFDAAEPTPISVTDLGPGFVAHHQWLEGHGYVLQAGQVDAPAPAKLVRFEDGEFVVTSITPAGTVGRVTRLAFTPDGSGALLQLHSNFGTFLPDPQYPDDCSVVWIEYDEARQPVAVTELEPERPDCNGTDVLPELELDAAGELAAWLVHVGDQVALRVVEIDGVPGPVQTLAVTPKRWDYGLFVDADKLTVSLDVDDDGEREFVVYDRANLDAPPATYPFEGPREFSSWSENGDFVVWRPGSDMQVWFLAFDGLVPSTPVTLVGPEVVGGFGERITSEGKVRFVYETASGERRGFAEVEVGPEGPGPAMPITGPLPDDEQVRDVEHRDGTLATAYEIQSVPPDQGTIGIAVLDTGASPIDQRVYEVAAESDPYFSWPPGAARRLLVIEMMQPEHRISIVDLDTPEPWGEVLAEGSVGARTIYDTGWSASGEHVLLRLRDENEPDAIARVPLDGGEPEIVFSIEDATLDSWWALNEGF